MKYISKAEYERREELFIREQYELTKPKPNGMLGHWGWHSVKKREFKEMMMKEGYTIDG
jgi:hypothetical protein